MHRNIKLLLGSSIFIHMGLNILAPVYALYVQRVGGGILEASFSIGVYALLRGILYFGFAKLKEKPQHHKPLLFVGYSLYAVAYVGYIFAFLPLHLFLIQGLLAFADTILNPCWSAVIATSLTSGKERGIYSQFYGIRSMFEALGAFIGGIAIVYWGFTQTFLLMAAFAMCAALLTLFLRIEHPTES
jgi:predicted MFS family arabinose efflux permease